MATIVQFFWVLIIVLINILTILATRYATQVSYTETIVMILLGILFVNAFKFLLWGYVHKRYPLGRSYPIVAIFYPLMYVISIYYGEAQWEATKIVGSSLILIGVVILNSK